MILGAAPDDGQLVAALGVVGRFARAWRTPFDVLAVLDGVTGMLRDALDMSAVVGLLAPADGDPLVSVRPAELENLRDLLVEPALAGLEPNPNGSVVLISDLVAEGFYPHDDLPSLGPELTLRAVASIPVRMGEEPIGVVLLCSSTTREWPPSMIAFAQTLADVTGAYLAMAIALREESARADQLQHALNSRVLIEQAKGILAASAGVSIDAATERMRSHARRHRVKLEVVAEAIVRLGLLP